MRAMINESTDHGNDVLVVQFVLLRFLMRIIQRKNSAKMDIKNCQLLFL